MCLPSRTSRVNTLTRVGLLFFTLANFARFFLHPNALFSRWPVDGFVGLLYGVSIGCMLLGIRQKGRTGPLAS
jgi:hypothetical protein